jgi:hypothetical protein
MYGQWLTLAGSVTSVASIVQGDIFAEVLQFELYIQLSKTVPMAEFSSQMSSIYKYQT